MVFTTVQKTLDMCTHISPRGPAIWKDKRKSASNGNAKWQTTTSSTLSITNANKKSLIRSDNCQVCYQFVLNEAFSWRASADQLFCGLLKAGKKSHKMDKSMWQTLGPFDFVHSQHE